jgi:hypothetical protein
MAVRFKNDVPLVLAIAAIGGVAIVIADLCGFLDKLP